MKKFKKREKKPDKLVSNFDIERTIIYNKDNVVLSREELYKNSIGFLIYIVIFVITIPHLLLKNKFYLVAALYFCNLDMIATVLGFSGGPYEIWKYLYNPATSSIIGFVSSTIINYLSLIGVGFVCMKYALTHKNIYRGMAMLFIILPITYLLPGNLIVYIMNNIATILYNKKVTYYIRWLISLVIGFLVVIGIISIERKTILTLSPYLERLIKQLYKYYKL